MVLHSDGLITRWSLKHVGGLLQCDPAVVAGWLLRDYTRGHDDVTVVALYAELDTQAQQLQRATDLKSRFLAYMSHEFRTPISAIRSLSGLLLDRVDGPLNDEQDKQVSFIESTAEEFAGMVNDLLDLAKVEAGRVEISPAWFKMVDLFSALRGMFRPVLTNQEVTLVFEDPQQSSRLFTDDKKLSRILRNFISNALKFTLKGEVRVSAQENRAPAWACRSASNWPNCSAAGQDCRASWAPVRRSPRRFRCA